MTVNAGVSSAVPSTELGSAHPRMHSNNRWRTVTLGSVAREDSMRPRLQSGASVRPLNFTVRRHQ
jgi:hypothetical protein